MHPRSSKGRLGGHGLKPREYRFVTNWFIPNARCEDVSDVLAASATLPQWWPAVYLEATVIEPGRDHGLGRVLALRSKGWLPYALRWTLRIESVDYPHASTVSAWGDLSGRGIGTLRQHRGGVHASYEWSVSIEKPLLRCGSFVLSPLFAANHRWAMATGELSLRREVARRQGALVDPPPQPAFWGVRTMLDVARVGE
jgi:hypothetical protein